MSRRIGSMQPHGRVRVGVIAAVAAATLVGGAMAAHPGFALAGSTPGGTTSPNSLSSVGAPAPGAVPGLSGVTSTGLRGATSTVATTGTAATSTSSSSTSAGSCPLAGQAADKAAVVGSTLAQVSPFASQQLLCVKMRTSTPEDLLLSVTTECSILTQVSTTGTASSSASGTIDVWVTVDGQVVPVDPSQPADKTKNGQVTFCNRDATQNFTDGDSSNSGSDTLTEYLKTKEANGFNWAKLDTGNGIHTIAVYATFIPGSSCTDAAPAANSTTTNCTGEIGNRTLTIEPTKFAQ